MQHLQKTWVRVLVSLFGGGMVSELMHITTGDPDRPMTTNLSLIYGVIIYIGLSAMIKNNVSK